jgi:small-conductance mechanosensitive channel
MSMTPGPVVIQTDPAPLDVRTVAEKASILDEGAGVLFYGILGPPLLTLLNLELSYALTPVACRAGTALVMHLTTAILLALVIVAGVGAATRLRRNWIEDTVLSRPGFMAMLGMLASTLFSVVIIAQWLPHAFLSACQ